MMIEFEEEFEEFEYKRVTYTGFILAEGFVEDASFDTDQETVNEYDAVISSFNIYDVNWYDGEGNPRLIEDRELKQELKKAILAEYEDRIKEYILRNYETNDE